MPLMYSYFDDLLFLAVVLPIALFAVRARVGGWTIVLSKRQVLGAVAGMGILWENVYPHISDRFTGDPLDVVCYGVGALVFWVVFNEPKAEECGLDRGLERELKLH